MIELQEALDLVHREKYRRMKYENQDEFLGQKTEILFLKMEDTRWRLHFEMQKEVRTCQPRHPFGDLVRQVY